MHRRPIAASVATLSALFVAASPAFADQEFLGTEAAIDWRLVVILSALFVFAFHTVLEFVNRGR